MQWVEIINIRLAVATEHLEMEHLFRDIRKNISEAREDGLRIVIYRCSVVDNDWAVHLHWKTADMPPRRTGLGIKLADFIRPMALVDHSIWIEEEWGGPLADPKTEFLNE